MPFNSVRIEYQHSGCPQRIETVEVGGMFFDVCLEWDEVFVDECRDLIVAVRLGFQPSTSTSGRRRAEIDEQGFLVVFCFGECRVGISYPIYFHSRLLFATKKHKKHKQ